MSVIRLQRELRLKRGASGGSLESEWIPPPERRGRREGRELQRAGLVGDQMSSQWGRNVEVRMGGREEARRGSFLSGCHVSGRRGARTLQHADKSLRRMYEM